MKHPGREGAHFHRSFMADQAYVPVRLPTCYDSSGTDWTVCSIRSRYMCTIRRPGTATEVSGKWRRLEGLGYGDFAGEVVDLVLRGGIWTRGVESKYIDGAVVARSRKVLVGRIKSDAFDMTVVVC